MSFLDPTQLTLEAAMRGSMQRQTLLTKNLANADTPGYQRQDLNFQSSLQSALVNGASPQDATFTPYTQAGISGTDGIGVDPATESAQISENALLYQELTQVASARNAILKTAIGNA